jgi:tetratricopeptide (TPR) repeat protein
MDDSDRPSSETADSAPEQDQNGPRRDENSPRRSRERRRRKVPPASIKRNYLLHILFYDRAFRWLAVVGILLFGSLGVLWPRIFVTSPEGVFPVIRISGLDLMKARSLKQTAQAAEAAGKLDEAIQAWVAALASNQADLELNRGLLKTLAGAAKPDITWLRLMANTSDWLLVLSGTNQADLELTARANASYGQWDWIIHHLGGTNSLRTEITTPALLAALFEKGLVQRFAAEWAAYRSQGGALLPSTPLYVAAWTAGWGPSAEYLEELATLENATKKPELQDLAYRLLLQVDYQRIDVAAYEQHFERLRQAGGDRVRHHVRLWNLLQLTGQRARAVELAQGFGDVPASVDEAEAYLNTLAALKQNRILLDFAKERLPKFTAAPSIWVRAAAALMQVGEWDELRGLAVDMRQHDRLNAVLGNLSWFFDGVGEHSLGRKARAEDGFSRFLEKLPADPQLNFWAAVTLTKLGYADFATRLLRTLETAAGKSAEFWRQMQQAAYEAREVDTLIEASRRLYLMQANDPVVANNYAASLLLRGDRGSEAVKVTLEVLDRLPDSAPARLNRALALLQVGRVDEVLPLLESLRGVSLEPATLAVLHFTSFRLHEVKGESRQALEAAGKIEQRLLFPAQVEQLNASLVKLKPAQ